MKSLLLAVVLSSSATAASASQFALPFHAPPRLRPAPGQLGLRLGLGWSAARGADIALEGPGGGWELAAMSQSGLAGHVRADGYGLSGRGAPLQGARRAVGFTGTLEGDASWSPGGPKGAARFYGGGAVNLTSLSFADAGSINIGGGRLSVEPDTALSLTIGLPLGVSVRRRLGERWAVEGAANVVAWLGGRTFFTYGPAGPFGRGSARKVDPNGSAGLRVSLEHFPSRLSLEAGASASAAAGNNDAHAMGWAQLALHLF